MDSIKIFLYSKQDGKLIKEFPVSQMFEARTEYENLVRTGNNPGYLESTSFPLSNPDSGIVWDKNLLNFRPKTPEERINEGSLVLKPWQKIINNVVMDKNFYELYQEGQIFNTPETIIYKVTEGGRVFRKNLVELFDIKYDKKLILEGVYSAINKVLDNRRKELNKKFPKAESDFFTMKANSAAEWLKMNEEEKSTLVKDPLKRGVFNLLFEEFWLTLSEEQKNDYAFLVSKLNDLCVTIAQNNKAYSEVVALIVNERIKVTSTWKGKEEQLTREDLISLHTQYGLNPDETYLFETVYTIPPDLNAIDPRQRLV